MEETEEKKEFVMDIPKIQRCQKCGQSISSSRIFRVRDERRVCDSCYMELTEGNMTGWHPNKLELTTRRDK